jgi:hypothetical protein
MVLRRIFEGIQGFLPLFDDPLELGPSFFDRFRGAYRDRNPGCGRAA